LLNRYTWISHQEARRAAYGWVQLASIGEPGKQGPSLNVCSLRRRNLVCRAGVISDMRRGGVNAARGGPAVIDQKMIEDAKGHECSVAFEAMEHADGIRGFYRPDIPTRFLRGQPPMSKLDYPMAERLLALV
jgi:hypothetical protein